MANYSQAKRPLRIETPLGTDKLLITGLSGHEATSSLFRYRLDLMSEDPGISGADLLRKPVAVAIDVAGRGVRWIHGQVARFAQLGRRDDLTFYEAEIVPAVWFLSLTRDCRIFQNMTAQEIVDRVLSDCGVTDYSFEWNSPSSEKREYCVQYRETHLDFIQRLLEEEGVHYTFQHRQKSHRMVIGDAMAPVPDVAGEKKLRFATQADEGEDIITDIRREDSVWVGKVTLNDYDYMQPTLNLVSSVSGKGVGEIYDYPGKYAAPGIGEHIARIRLEAEEAMRESVRGEGSCRALTPGSAFVLVDHYNSKVNRGYRLVETALTIRAGDYRSWDAAEYECHCSFVAIPESTPYRPPVRTPRPVVQGSQTALVVGPSGEEIYVDKYGRVKVQFYWDRDGKKNENSSCWVRVSSGWAGKKWGAIHIPRIGQEVIVDFLEGDPDLPIITGRVWNDDQMPPYDLPANKTQSGIKSRSSPGGSTEMFNEIRMEDAKGKELLYVHAQKDKQVIVENDRSEEVGKDEKIAIGGNRAETVKGNEKIDIGGNRDETVSGSETITIKGKRTEKVDGSESVEIGSSRKVEVGSSEALKVGSSRSTKVGTSDKLDVGTALSIKAGTAITLKVGGNSIKIDNSGITIKGIQVKVQGMAKAEMSAPMTAVKGTAMLQAKAPINQTGGDGILQLRGGITMIN
jgi:type VI secretion system secreted protein VgrG